MQTVLIVLHLMVVIALVATVLLQRSEGGALGVGGGGGFMTGRGQANALTRATAILGTLFFVTSLGLTLLAHYNRAPKSIIDQIPQGTRSQPATIPPAGATPLDQLRQLEQQKDGATPPPTSTQGAPASPAAPAQPEVPKSQ
jgi:preprotein translocase subunit SecG